MTVKFLPLSSMMQEAIPSASGAFPDISGRKQMEADLRERDEKYKTILDSIDNGYYEVDMAGNLTFFNDSLCRIWGYSSGKS